MNQTSISREYMDDTEALLTAVFRLSENIPNAQSRFMEKALEDIYRNALLAGKYAGEAYAKRNREDAADFLDVAIDGAAQVIVLAKTAAAQERALGEIKFSDEFLAVYEAAKKAVLSLDDARNVNSIPLNIYNENTKKVFRC